MRPGTRLVSICTGAFLLAAAGLLDGRRATAHWALADWFRELFPQVELDAGVLFVDLGDVLTSAGAASGVDVCLHLVRHLLESSDLPVDRVAHEVGFATATSLRRDLAAEAGVAPSAYRRTFRASDAAPGATG